MNQLAEKKLEELLGSRKWDEAKRLLSSYLDSDLSLEEKGAAYVAFVSTYVRMMNQINSQYERILDDMLSELRQERQEMHSLEEQGRLANLDEEIDKMGSGHFVS